MASTLPASWDHIARICRRVCLLRERGDESAADVLARDALAKALIDFRATSAESTEDIDARLHATFEAEHERVANAATLAEFLAPLLRDRLTGAALGPPVARSNSTAAVHGPAATPFEARRSPADIAGFIDEMIAQEQRSHAPVRRAS